MMQLRSPDFSAGADIPPRHTCDGEDVAPALSWTGVPEGAASLALVVDDPDAPDPAAPRGEPWVHWVLYDLPPDCTSLPPGGTPLPHGAHEGLNDWARRGWDGPCPPRGRHHYAFRLYALDRRLGRLDPPSRESLARAMAGHVIATAELVGTYRRPGA